MPDTIREFLVGLGFKTDQDSLDKFTRAIEGATLRAKLLGDAVEGMAESTYKAISDTAENFEKLYWQSQRLNTSISSIRAFSFAVSQLGGDAAQANSSLNAFGEFLKYHPGTRNLVSGRVGHNIEGEDAGQVVSEIGAYLRTLSVPQQKLQATQMHLDDLTYNAVINPGFQKWYSEEFARGNAAGVGKTAEDSMKLEQSFRELNQAAGDLLTQGLDPLIKSMTAWAKWLDAWLNSHHDKVEQAVEYGTSGQIVNDVLSTHWKRPGEIGQGDDKPKFGDNWTWPSWLRNPFKGMFSGWSASDALGVERAQADDLPIGIGPQWAGVNADLPIGTNGTTPASAPHVNGSPVSDSNPMPVRVVEDTTSGGGGFGGWVKSLFGGVGASGSIGGSTSGSTGEWSGRGNAGIGGWWTPERMKYAADRLVKEAGLTPEGAAGLVARWAAVEAPGGPTSVNPKSGAAGIAQGLGARRLGYTGSFEDQVTNAIRELNGAEKRAGDILRKATTAAEGARGASAFERAEGYNPISGMDNYTNATPVEKVLKAINGAGAASATKPSEASNNGMSRPYGSADAGAAGGHLRITDPSGNNTYDPGHDPAEHVFGGKKGVSWPTAPSAWQGIDSLLPVGGGVSNVRNNHVSSTVNNSIHVETSDPATAAAMVGDHLDRTSAHITENLQGAIQ